MISVLEEGDYLALDLGGTNFRVLLCRMREGQCESLSRNYNVPEHKLHGPAADVRQFLSCRSLDLLGPKLVNSLSVDLSFHHNALSAPAQTTDAPARQLFSGLRSYRRQHP